MKSGVGKKKTGLGKQNRMVTKGKRSGPGLKPGVNEADTGSVVGQVKGAVKLGFMKKPR